MTIRCLTVCQPYATLIALPDDDPRAKRVENRSRRTGYGGTLYVHAGLSRKCLVNPGDIPYEEDYGLTIADMAFGAVVAVAELVGSLYVPRFAGSGRPSVNTSNRERYPWLQDHAHLEGPFAWILADVRPLPEPVPCRGMQRLWLPPEKVVAEVSRQLEMMELAR